MTTNLIEKWEEHLRETARQARQRIRPLTLSPADIGIYGAEVDKLLGYLPEDWTVRVSEVGTIEAFTSPEGKELTGAEFESFITPKEPAIPPARQFRIAVEQGLIPEGSRFLGIEAGQIKYIPPGEVAPQVTPEMPPEAHEALRAIFPEETLGEILNYADTNPAGFLTDLREVGRTTETEAILKMFGASEFEIWEIFGGKMPIIPAEGQIITLQNPNPYTPEVPQTKQMTIMPDYSVLVDNKKVGAYDPETGQFQPYEPLWQKILRHIKEVTEPFGMMFAAPELREWDWGTTWRAFLKGELLGAPKTGEWQELKKEYEALPWWRQLLYETPLYMMIPSAYATRAEWLGRAAKGGALAPAYRVGAAVLRPMAGIEAAQSQAIFRITNPILNKLNSRAIGGALDKVFAEQGISLDSKLRNSLVNIYRTQLGTALETELTRILTTQGIYLSDAQVDLILAATARKIPVEWSADIIAREFTNPKHIKPLMIEGAEGVGAAAAKTSTTELVNIITGTIGVTPTALVPVGAGIPTMITSAMATNLGKLGYGAQAIAQMTPAKAWGILTSKMPDVYGGIKPPVTYKPPAILPTKIAVPPKVTPVTIPAKITPVIPEVMTEAQRGFDLGVFDKIVKDLQGKSTDQIASYYAKLVMERGDWLKEATQRWNLPTKDFWAMHEKVTQLSQAKPAIPKAEVGMPEAGVTELELYQVQQEIAGLKEWLSTEPARKLVNLIRKVGWYKGEVKNLTLKQYRDITGKTEIKPNILTADKKHVRWEYALDDIATEMGYESSDALKEAIERAGEAQVRIKALEAEIASTEVPTAPLKEVVPPTKPPTPSAPAVTASVPTPPVSPTELTRIITLSKEQVRQNRPGLITRILDRIPGLKRLLEWERPGLKMTGEKENVLVAMVAETQARSDVATRELATRMPIFKKITELFGKDSLHGGKVDIKFIGKEEDASNPITNSLKDIMDNPWVYDLSSSQRKFIVDFNNRNNEMLSWVVDKYGAEIGKYVPYEGAAYLPNVDISEDIIEYLGSETRTVVTGRGKARIWQTARDRMASDKTFKPELDIQKLIEGMDSFKASAAGGITYRQAIGGLTRLEAMEKTHPKLYDRMMALRKELQSLQGSAGTIESNVHKAIFDFLNSPVEGVDLMELRDNLDVKLKSGPRVTFNVEAVQDEIARVREQIKELRPAWEVANLKPYVFITEGLYRYFPADQANLIRESRQITNNPLLRFIERWRGMAFSGDFSPFAIQGTIGVLADPVGNLKAAFGGMRSAIEHQDWNHSFTVDGLADDVAADPDGWAQFASLMGRQLTGTPMEYSAGFLSVIPGFNKFTESTYITVTRESKAMWDRITKQLIKSGTPEIEAKVAAIEIVNKVYPLVNPRVLGQSPARTTLLRALPTSYSFIRQPASLIANAVKGFAKLATLQKLTAQEKVAVKVISTMAAMILIVSATSAALTAMYRKKKKEEILQAILDAINPDPYNGKFASVILPIGEHDVRVPLGGPYRNIFRAIYPQDVKGIPFPVPFAGIPMYLRNRITPAIRTQLDLLLNKDYSKQQIIKGQFPENIIRGLLYELEEALPLSLGTLVEDIRHNWGDPAFKGKEWWEIRNDVIGQFMGVNLITLDNTYFDRRIRQLGLPDPTKTIPLYSTEKPLYQTNDLWGDTIWIFRDMTIEEIHKRRFPPLIQAIAEAKVIKDQTDLLRNHSLISLNADLSKGDTFVIWYQQWLAREKLLDDPAKLAQFDKDNPQAYLGNMTLREYDALTKYLALKESNPKEAKAFLEAHPELTANPRNDWLKSHPKENAQLAIWGQAKILTKEAYNQFLGLLKTLDIPDDAIPSMTLPPKTSIETHFEYLDMVADGKHGSWEAQLLLKLDARKAKEAGVKSYAEWADLTLSDIPIASLELKTIPKFREIYDKLQEFSDKDSPNYLDDTIKDADGFTERDRAVAELKAIKVDGDFTYRDIERKVEAIEKGTDETPIPDALVKAHVDYGRLIDQEGIGSTSAEAMLFRVDNPDYNAFRMDEAIWDKPLEAIDESKIPIWRLQVKYKEDFTLHDAYGDKDSDEYIEDDSDRATKRQEMLFNPDGKLTDFGRAYYTKEAYTTGYSRENWEKFVEYSELPAWGDWGERFLLDPANKSFYAEYVSKDIGKHPLITEADVSPVERDEIYLPFKEQFDDWDDTAGMSEDEVKNMRAELDKIPGFKDTRYRVKAYDKGFPVEYHDDYVEWFTNESLQRPEGYDPNLSWYEDDWFLMEHPEFHTAMVALYIATDGKEGWKEKRDFSEVPTREVWKLYLIYRGFASSDERLAFRRDHPDLDAWGVLALGWKPATGRIAGQIETWREKLAIEASAFDEMIAAMKKSLYK